MTARDEVLRVLETGAQVVRSDIVRALLAEYDALAAERPPASPTEIRQTRFDELIATARALPKLADGARPHEDDDGDPG